MLAAALLPPALSAQELSVDTARARGSLAEARALCRADGGRLWGQSLCGPLALVEPRSRAVVADQAGAPGADREAGGLWLGTLPPEVGAANTAVDWRGRRWTLVLWPLPELAHQRGRLLVHELFHRVQPELGIPVADPPNAHLDTEPGRRWLRMEWRALAAALLEEGEARRRAVADALAFRAHRRALLPGAAAEENALELSEGLAEYTGLRLGGLPERVLADRAAVQLEAYDGRESLTRSFAYASGPAYGVLLDEAGARWRPGLAAGSDLGALLARAYRVEPGAGEGVEARAARYDGHRVAEAEAARARRRAEEQLRLRARFVEGPTLILPVAGELGFTFNPNDAATLEGQGTVYGSARITAGWGVLTVERGGVLFRRQGGGFTGFAVPAPADTAGAPLSGDGWRLELAPGWAVARGQGAGRWVVRKNGGG